MHQKQPPPRSAITVLFVFMELIGCADAYKYTAPTVSRKQIILFIIAIAGGTPALLLRFVQLFARRQIDELRKMLRPQRLRNGVLAAKPFPEVNQPAPLRTKRPEFASKPVAGFFARGTDGRAPISFRWQSL